MVASAAAVPVRSAFSALLPAVGTPCRSSSVHLRQKQPRRQRVQVFRLRPRPRLRLSIYGAFHATPAPVKRYSADLQNPISPAEHDGPCLPFPYMLAYNNVVCTLCPSISSWIPPDSSGRWLSNVFPGSGDGTSGRRPCSHMDRRRSAGTRHPRQNLGRLAVPFGLSFPMSHRELGASFSRFSPPRSRSTRVPQPPTRLSIRGYNHGLEKRHLAVAQNRTLVIEGIVSFWPTSGHEALLILSPDVP